MGLALFVEVRHATSIFKTMPRSCTRCRPPVSTKSGPSQFMVSSFSFFRRFERPKKSASHQTLTGSERALHHCKSLIYGNTSLPSSYAGFAFPAVLFGHVYNCHHKSWLGFGSLFSCDGNLIDSCRKSQLPTRNAKPFFRSNQSHD